MQERQAICKRAKYCSVIDPSLRVVYYFRVNNFQTLPSRLLIGLKKVAGGNRAYHQMHGLGKCTVPLATHIEFQHLALVSICG